MLFCICITRPSRAHTYNLAFPLPLTVERRRGRPTGSVRVDTSTRREPLAFEQNIGYTTVRVGVGAGWAQGGRGRRAGAGLSARRGSS